MSDAFTDAYSSRSEIDERLEYYERLDSYAKTMPIGSEVILHGVIAKVAWDERAKTYVYHVAFDEGGQLSIAINLRDFDHFGEYERGDIYDRYTAMSAKSEKLELENSRLNNTLLELIAALKERGVVITYNRSFRVGIDIPDRES